MNRRGPIIAGAIVLLVAFGPFVVLGLVIWVRRRHEPPSTGE